MRFFEIKLFFLNFEQQILQSLFVNKLDIAPKYSLHKTFFLFLISFSLFAILLIPVWIASENILNMKVLRWLLTIPHAMFYLLLNIFFLNSLPLVDKLRIKWIQVSNIIIFSVLFYFKSLFSEVQVEYFILISYLLSTLIPIALVYFFDKNIFDNAKYYLGQFQKNEMLSQSYTKQISSLKEDLLKRFCLNFNKKDLAISLKDSEISFLNKIQNYLQKDEIDNFQKGLNTKVEETKKREIQWVLLKNLQLLK